MGAIYRKASSVRVWLGPDDDGDKDAIPILKTMLSVTGAKDITLGLDTGSRDRISQLQRFFARSWWERLLVVQEVALGQKVVLQQGTNELEYDDLLTAYHTSVKVFGENLRGLQQSLYSSSGQRFMEIFESVKTLGQARQLCNTNQAEDNQGGIRQSAMKWMTIANLVRNRKASVDRDRLYSLYGLLPTSVVQSPGMEPSYSVTAEEAFVDVTYNIMEVSKSLMAFNFLERDPNKPAILPSWTPDFRLSPENTHESNLRVARETLFNASNNAPFYLRRLSSNTILLKGFFIDVIQ